ncbi:hypothetical protein [Deinococcus radiophilus]|uniref:hypothetical protein n=1 Tax=Deinococcus radiophilus TaxID=32062 RepID=UPI00361FD8D0
MGPLYGSGGQPVQLGPELGRGGQGTVYALADDPGQVAKLYLRPPGPAQVRKLEALTALADPVLLTLSAWPTEALRGPAGEVRGFLMPRLPAGEMHELHCLYTPATRSELFPEATWAFLVHTARNLARAFAALHTRGVLMGDVSSRNVMVGPAGTVRLIDTDSFQVRSGGEVLPCPVGTPEFTPPELQGQALGTLVRTEAHDLFGLATLIFHLLFQGRHPYAGVQAAATPLSPAEAIAGHAFAYSAQPLPGLRPPPGTLRLSDLTAEVAALFERAFAPAPAPPRPTAAEWDTALATLGQALEPCRQGHTRVRGLACPHCRVHPLARIEGTQLLRLADLDRQLAALRQRIRALQSPPPLAVLQHIAPAPRTAPLLLPAPPPPADRTEWAVIWTGRLALLLVLLAFGVLIHWLGPLAQWSLVLLGVLAAAYPELRHLLEAAFDRYFPELTAAWMRLALGERSRAHALYTLRRDLQVQQTREEALKAELLALTLRAQQPAEYSRFRSAQQAVQTVLAETGAVEQARRAELDALGVKYHQSARREYLRRQPLTAGVAAGIGAAEAARLHAAGLRVAADLTPAALRSLTGLSSGQQQALLRYRQAWKSSTRRTTARFRPARWLPCTVAMPRRCGAVWPGWSGKRCAWNGWPRARPPSAASPRSAASCWIAARYSSICAGYWTQPE